MQVTGGPEVFYGWVLVASLALVLLLAVALTAAQLLRHHRWLKGTIDGAELQFLHTGDTNEAATTQNFEPRDDAHRSMMEEGHHQHQEEDCEAANDEEQVTRLDEQVTRLDADQSRTTEGGERLSTIRFETARTQSSEFDLETSYESPGEPQRDLLDDAERERSSGRNEAAAKQQRPRSPSAHVVDAPSDDLDDAAQLLDVE